MSGPALMLASASPRRIKLLEQIGAAPDRIEPVSIAEEALAGEFPGPLARRLAIEKARMAAAALEATTGQILVLGADTVVACGRRVLPKTEDENEARAYLALLSGRRHKVYTGVAVVVSADRCHHRLATTAVGFKRLSNREIDDYIASGEWRGKAGAYAIQGRAAALVRFIGGSYSNVVGLPLFETAQLLKACGYGFAAPIAGSR